MCHEITPEQGGVQCSGSEIALNICFALKARCLLQSNDFYLLTGKPVACLGLGWKIAVKLQQEGFSPLNICHLPGRLVAETIDTYYFLPQSLSNLPPRQQTLL